MYQDQDQDHKEYWNKRNAEINASDAAWQAHRQTFAGILELAERRLATMHADSAPYTDEQRAEQQALVDSMSAEQSAKEQAAEDAEWTADVTAQRRVVWNAAVKSPKYLRGRTFLQGAAQRDLGFGWETLRRQVARHGK